MELEKLLNGVKMLVCSVNLTFDDIRLEYKKTIERVAKIRVLRLTFFIFFVPSPTRYYCAVSFDQVKSTAEPK